MQQITRIKANIISSIIFYQAHSTFPKRTIHGGYTLIAPDSSFFKEFTSVLAFTYNQIKSPGKIKFHNYLLHHIAVINKDSEYTPNNMVKLFYDSSVSVSET